MGNGVSFTASHLTGNNPLISARDSMSHVESLLARVTGLKTLVSLLIHLAIGSHILPVT